MSASPLVVRATDALKPAGSIGSPFKNVSSNQASANGTPQPPKDKNAPASLPPTLDLAEQMNEEEKRKYVKGMPTI